MQINLTDLKNKCLSRGNFPECCNGCPANNSNPTEFDTYGIVTSCTVGIPRSWNIERIETTISKLFNEDINNKNKTYCYLCKYVGVDKWGESYCTIYDTTTDLCESFCTMYKEDTGYNE